ncbi:HET domain containing protein [Hyaloscypha variabilis]
MDTSQNGASISPICSECKSIFDHWYDRDDWAAARPGHSHRHIVGLQESSRNGCSVCALFLRGLSGPAVNILIRDWPQFKNSVTVAFLPYHRHMYIINLTFDLNTSGGGDELKTSLHAFASVKDSTEIGTIQQVANTEDNWALIRKWLDVCQNTHTRCIQNNSLDGRQLPTRLVEVGDADKDLRLCRTDILPRYTQYLTLSHCWGGKVFTMLTRSNFRQFQTHIPAESLTKTFREAIVTTRRLGFKYIWIDSLCIVQGDETDWLHEASRMGSVYSNSTLNIAASAALNGDVGCFTAREPGVSRGCKVVAVERETYDSLQNACRIWDITIPNLSLKLAESVLESRAWIHQELFLARRTLYFAPEQLVWECISAKACETFPDSYDDKLVTIPNIKFDRWDLPSSVAEKWAGVISQYCYKSVTFQKDKLIAVSGIARLFAEKFGTTYLAGMWKEDLIIQLTWFAWEPSSGDIRGTMPSWSWAATDNIIFNDSIHRISRSTPLAAVLEATTIVVDDTFGDVRGGTIRIKCLLPLVVRIVRLLQMESTTLFGIRFYDLDDITYLRFYPDRVPYFDGQELYILPLIEGIFLEKGQAILGLVIEPVQTGSYRRTGYFGSMPDDIEGFSEAKKRASYEDKYFVGEALGPDDDGQKMCIITLI